MPGCKQGELAYVAKSLYDPSRVGLVVTCVEQVPVGFEIHDSIAQNVKRGYQRCYEPGDWLVQNSEGRWLHGDARLIPIRDNPGQDETLAWKPVPTTLKEST